MVVAHAADAPFPIDAIALEEDTWLALSAGIDSIVVPRHPIHVMTQVWEARPREPGTVVVQRGRPVRLLAVVHDLDREPSWTQEWVERALSAVLRAAVELGCEALQLPLLGTRHGDMPARRFVSLLRRALPSVLGRCPHAAPLRRIWLARNDESGAELLEILRRGDAGAQQLPHTS